MPVWEEIFQVPLKQSDDDEKPRLEVLLYDHDAVSAPDFMGRVTVDVDGLGDTKAPLRQWYALMPEEGKSTDVKGHVELITQWWCWPCAFEPTRLRRS